MLSFIKGQLVAKAIESPRGAYFIVETGGLGLEILSSERSVASSPAVSESVTLFTSLIVREDAMFLVGFNSKEERDLFNILQSASGVGTKVALSLLSTLSVSEIAQAVVANQHKVLSQAKGVGPKLAQKIALELKEKMMAWRKGDMADAVTAASAGAIPNQADESTYREAESVLLSLGYQPNEIVHSFQAIGPAAREEESVSSEWILREALRWLAQSV